MFSFLNALLGYNRSGGRSNSIRVERRWTTEAGYPAVCGVIDEGYRNGYVLVPDDHPWAKPGEHPAADVHGGVTFCAPASEGWPSEEPSGWWVGFDCGHACDGLMPTCRPHGRREEMNRLFEGTRDPDAPVRSEEFVVAECEKLAAAARKEATP